MTVNIINEDIQCAECGHSLNHFSNGQRICSWCGLVISPQYVHVPPLLQDGKNNSPPQFAMHTPSLISGLGGHYQGQGFMQSRGSNQNSRLRRLNWASKFIKSYLNIRAFLAVTSDLGIPRSTVTHTIQIFRKYHPKRVFHNGHVLMAALLIITSRQHGQIVYLKELSNFYEKRGHRVSIQKIIQCLLVLRQQFKLHAPHLEPIKYFPRIYHKLKQHPIICHHLTSNGVDMDKFFQDLYPIALEIVQDCQQQIGGRNPIIFIVSCIYAGIRNISHNYRCGTGGRGLITQNLLGQIFGCSSCTIRDNSQRFLRKYMKL